MERRKNPSQKFLRLVAHLVRTLQKSLVKVFKAISKSLKKSKIAFLTRLTKFLDPRLEKYRPPRAKKLTPRAEQHVPASGNLTPDFEKHAPAKTADFTGVDFSPKNLTPETKNHAPAAENLTPVSQYHAPDLNLRVSELMLPASVITYVNDDEVLGPLTLDRLYKSGFQHFPVIDGMRRIIGLIHTTSFNNLENKQTRHVREILDPKVYYLREDYDLNQVLAAFLRTNCYFFIVIDRFERIVGLLTYEVLLNHLLGETPQDDFERDSDRWMVAKRKL